MVQRRDEGMREQGPRSVRAGWQDLRNESKLQMDSVGRRGLCIGARKFSHERQHSSGNYSER